MLGQCVGHGVQQAGAVGGSQRKDEVCPFSSPRMLTSGLIGKCLT
jgi:hypothetical protein